MEMPTIIRPIFITSTEESCRPITPGPRARSWAMATMSMSMSGLNADGKPNSFDFEVPIPGQQMLDARVLESTGYISHPLGLNWYHSHIQGISSDQVMGGM